MDTKVCAADMKLIREQTASMYKAETLPISFIYDKRKIKGIPSDFKPTCTVFPKSDTVKDYVYTGFDESTGLEIQTTVTEYLDFPVMDIVTYFSNKGSNNTPMLRDIQGFDGIFRGKEPYLYSNSGDYYSENGYETRKEYYTNQMWTRFTPQTGRSCDQCFPYFKLQFEDFGLNIAIGWPAQWAADFSAILDGVILKAGQEITALYLKPGETIRTPKVTIMTYEGDIERGTNVWRRWYFAHILPRPNGKPLVPELCTSYNGGGLEFQEATIENQLEYIEKRTASGLPYTAWWIDAGWYLCDDEVNGGRHWVITGNWFADPKRFPDGLRPISEALKKHDMKLLVWFEPERVRKGTAFFNEHPEWMLNSETEDDGEWGISRNYLLNLGDKDCCDWLIEKIDALIKDYGIGIYRQDFNFPPLRFWRDNEDFDRQGINENLYVQGYLRYWDALIDRNPGLWIDSCSSGGRRNDLETLRRSVPLHPTDYGYGYHPVCQAFARALSTWIPYSRTVTVSWDLPDGTYPPINEVVGKPSDYFSQVSSLSPFYCPGFKDEPNAQDALMVKIWKQAAEIMLHADFYELSETSKKADSFCVNQFFCPEQKKGYIQAIRNTLCPQSTFTARLKDIDDSKQYVFENQKTGESLVKTGKELNEFGFDITLEKRDAAVWFYNVK